MARPLPREWRDWIQENVERGAALEEIYQRASRHGFDPDEISRELGGYQPEEASDLWARMFHAPLTRRGNQPRAWRLDTEQAQVYEIPGLLSPEECAALIEVIDTSLVPSTVTRGDPSYRTSRTCHLLRADPGMMKDIDQRISNLIGCDPACSEPIQGQRYDVGEYFKAHTDWFEPGADEFIANTVKGGQRTWTVMIYLNRVEEGGGTVFERIGRTFAPTPGFGLAWNNLGIDGEPNHDTLHEALPVERGSKYVITKWFRERPGLNG